MPESGGISDGTGKILTLEDLIAAIDRHEKTPSNVPKIDTFHFNGGRVSDWLDRVEQAMMRLSDAVKFQRIMRYVLYGHHQEVQRVVSDANDDWARFREGMQRKYRLGDGLLTTGELEAMNKDNFTTIEAFVQEFKKRARKVHGISEETQCAIFLGLLTASEAQELTGHGGGSTKLTWATIDKGVEDGSLDQVEQHQVRLQRQKRKERDATTSGTPGVRKIITDILTELGPVIQRKVAAAIQGKAKEVVIEEVVQKGWEEEETVPPHLSKVQRKQRNLTQGGRENEKNGLISSTMDGNIYDQFGDYIDRKFGGARAEVQRRAAAGPPPPAMFRLWQDKEGPLIGVEEVGSDEEVTQELQRGGKNEEPIIIESDDENEEERVEPPSVLLGKMEDLLDKMGRYQQKLVDLCEEVKRWRSNIPMVFLYDPGLESTPRQLGVNVVRSDQQSGVMGRPLTPQARVTQAARMRSQAMASASQGPPQKEPEPGKRKEAVEVEDDDEEEEEDESLRQEEDQRAELRAKKREAREETESVLRDVLPRKKKYAVWLEEGFDVEKVIDRLLEGHNDLMTLKEILASAPKLRDGLKGSLSRRLVPNVHLGMILPKEAEWAESGTKMDWKCVACGTVDWVVKGSKCTAMVDTGAKMNIIRETDAIKVGLDINQSDCGILHGASCRAVFCGTASNVFIEVGKVKVRACFFVMPDVDHGIVLGRSFLSRTETVIFNKHDGTLILLLCDPACGNYEIITRRNTGPKSIRNRPNPGSFTIGEPEEEERVEAFSLSLSDVGKAMDLVGAHEMADPDAIQALREQDLEKVLSLLEEHNLTASGVKSRHCMREATILRSDFTKTAMPRGGKGTWPPRRPLGASGGYERHGPRHRESTPVYDDGDIELFLDSFWDHVRRMGWTVAQAIERLRGASRFEEPIARIRREATTRQEVEMKMQELRPSPLGPDGRPIRLEIENAAVFIPAFEWFMQGQGTPKDDWARTLPLWTRKAERPLARQIRDMARDWESCRAHLMEAFRQPESPRPRVERRQRSRRQRDPEPSEAKPSRGGQNALARREEEQEPEDEERGAYPEYGLGPVEFCRFIEGGLRRSPVRIQEEAPTSEGPLRELEAHLDVSRWGASPRGEERGGQAEEVPW
ncbi:hypothetical protein CBR_g36667 [Chara braunii]|uniref:Peptidase A2 domain-containing protein n=1 Tax=Chara braunii TaxID=69332 RepID=A0A388LL44_CHABU|nr:hypothetical protein CBR_g36667 [Chara braunii]|eukprot:GBG83050.1 hypothetical protein CBR_g36667 [Chara braunii]